MHALRAASTVSLALVASCSDPAPLPRFVPPERAEEPAAPLPPPRAWQTVGSGLSILAIGGTSREDVFVLAADRGGGPGVFRFDGAAWALLPTATTGDLWAVHRPAPGESAFLAGAGSLVLRWDGTQFHRLPTPGGPADVVLGVWARRWNDVYAVGRGGNGSGFVWRFDGESFTAVALPASLPRPDGEAGPAFHSVWCDEADTWIAGSAGVLLHAKSAGPLARVATDRTDTFFSIHGAAGKVFAVGGASSGVALAFGASDGKRSDVSPRSSGVLRAVHASATQGVFAAGVEGVVLRLDPGTGRFEPVPRGPDARVQSFRAAYVAPEGDVWLGGGDVFARRGALAHLGPPHIPPLPDARGGAIDDGFFSGEKGGAPRR